MSVEDAYELAYREAVRALEHQRADLTELRSRASMLFWPHRDWNFDLDPQTLLSIHLSESAPNAVVISSDLIAHIAIHYRANGRRLSQMSRTFRIGTGLLAIQLVLTVLAAAVSF